MSAEISSVIITINSLKNMLESVLKNAEETKTQQTRPKPLRRISMIANIAKSILKSYDSHNPNLTITNVDGFSRLKEISIAPDIEFTTKGLFIITVNNVQVYELVSLEVFQLVKVQTIKIDEGLELKRNDKIKFHLKSSDGTEVKLAVSVVFSD